MTSKEMVNKYLNRFKTNSRNYGETFECEMFNAVIQDLNRLEELEKENAKLKKVLEILKEEPYILEIGLENFTYDKFDNTYYYEVEINNYEVLDFRNKIYVISKEKFDLLTEILLCQKD